MVRDINERGRSIQSILNQYNLHVKNAYDEFIKPTMKYADIIIPRGKENKVAIECVIDDIKLRLKKMGIQPEERWPLSPAINAKPKSVHPSIICEDVNYDANVMRTIYEVSNKLISNSDPSLKS